MKKKKPYNAVEEVRKIRERNSLKYWGKPELLFHDLRKAREKFYAS